MRVVIVGPTFPSKGGISQHTTLLAHELSARGDDVTLCSWASQYPKRLYPGEVDVPDARPEFPLFPATTRRLRWWWPIGWISAGWKHRRADVVILVVVTPFQVPAYLGVIAGLRPRRPRVLALCHNVLPHEARLFDRALMGSLLRRVDGVLTHTPALAAAAEQFTRAPVRSIEMPPHMPDAPVRLAAEAPVQSRVLFFGVVRPYKGVDVLVRALAEVPGIAATIAGEFWSDVEELRRLVAEQRVSDRVEILPGYVASGDIPRLFARSDAVVMPYRLGTASQNVQRAHAYGLPVVATRVASFPTDVKDGIDGILCDPDDPAALAGALRHLYEPGVLQRLRAGIEPADESTAWSDYVDALHEMAWPPRTER